ncbi:MAG: phosphotransferase [Actinomycetaceae bacterium]|nr:phosphocholine cytidylyltransferase/choline kinase family protein [Arcanobacterium sp.]MDD7504637.1 phosphotransferase [Actinomycetaceae bacterium]
MITRSEFYVLRLRSEHPEYSQRELSQCGGMSLGSVNKTIGELQLKGLLDSSGAITASGMSSLKPFKVDNAVILAAGLSSRFVPFSYESPKGLLRAKGEVLIERQIRQLRSVGITDIAVVVGFMAEQFFYLEDKYGVEIIVNADYARKNNSSSIYAARHKLANTYICSSDNYFTENPFEQYVYHSYYAASYVEGQTDEWCIETKGKHRLITGVTVGGHDSWVMLGHVYWSRSFSNSFKAIIEAEIDSPDTASKLWEEIYIEHIKELPMVMRPYSKGFIYEFDSVDDMRSFDPQFITNVSSDILDNIVSVLHCERDALTDFYPLKTGITNLSVHFTAEGNEYVYRHPGIGTERMINRENEVHALKLAKKLGLDSTFIYADSYQGWKISHFLPNARTVDPRDPDQLADALAMAKTLHASAAVLDNEFDFVDAGLEYEKVFESFNAPKPQGYEDLKASVLKLREQVRHEEWRTCICHNDFFEHNILVDPDGKMSLIDWEYAGMGDEANDFGTFCVCSKFREEEIDDALRVYLGREPTASERRHYWAFIVFAGWAWYVWALAKEAQGDNTGEWLYVYYTYPHRYADRVLALYQRDTQPTSER